MFKEILKFTLLFVALVAAQVLVFNHVCLFDVAIPLVFIYFILKLPMTISLSLLFTLSFVLGLTVDVFSNTQGMNALACTLIAALRNPMLQLYVPRQDELPNPEPSIRTLDPGVFAKYALTFVLVYCILFFLIEACTFFNFWLLILRMVCSAALTFFIILALDSMASAKNR